MSDRRTLFETLFAENSQRTTEDIQLNQYLQAIIEKFCVTIVSHSDWTTLDQLSFLRDSEYFSKVPANACPVSRLLI